MKNPGSELAVLAHLIKYPSCREALDQIHSGFFTDPGREKAFLLIRDMLTKGLSVDTGTFFPYFKLKHPTEPLTELHPFTLSMDKGPFHTHLKLCRELAVAREALGLSSKIQQMTQAGTSADELTDVVGSSFLQLSNVSSQCVENKNHLHKAVKAQLTSEKPARPYVSGIEDIDRFGGYGPSFMLVGAQYGVGKTPFAMRMALANALKGHPVIFWSGENPNADVMIGMMSMLTGIPLRRIMDGLKHLTEEERTQLRNAQEIIYDSSLAFLKEGPCSLHQLRARIETTMSRDGAGVVILDQFNKIEMPKSAKNRNDAYDYMADIMFSWKIQMPALYVTLAQLKTKGIEGAPQLTDVMWATRLEQNCDVGVVIDRPAASYSRMEMERVKTERLKEQIMRDQTIPPADRTKHCQAVDNDLITDTEAFVGQEKGRMGYGTWKVKVNYDPAALGFCDTATLQKLLPANQEVI